MTIEVFSNMNSERVRHRAVPEQENKGRAPILVLLHPGREGGVVSGWYGGEKVVKAYYGEDRDRRMWKKHHSY